MGSTVHRLIKLLPQLWPALCRHPSTKHVDQPFDYSHDLELDQDMSLFDVWLSSRLSNQSSNLSQAHASSKQNQKQDRPYLPPGSQRPLTFANLLLACKIVQSSSLDILALLWRLHPLRTVLFVLLTLIRGLLPAFRGYSQAMILDEIQNLISSGELPSSRLGHLILTEGTRMLAESLFNNIANHNENIVNSSVRYTMEYQQMQQRLRLDLPTMTDPLIRDLLYESDLFVRSFMGMNGFGMFSPFDLIRLLSTVAELLSQIYVLQSTSRSSSHLFLIVVLLFPTALSLLSSWIPSFNTSSEPLYNAEEAVASERQERMHTLAHREVYRTEVALFGLGPWVLQSWASARKMTLGLEKPQSSSSDTLPWLLTQTNISEMFLVIQNLPFLLYSSSPTLGSLALYRNSVQSLVFTVRTLASTCRMAFQSVFFMGAFAAAMKIEPKLSPRPDQRVKFKRNPKGMKLEVRNLSYTYPGNKAPTLRNVNFTLEAGETLAIVGYNGSGKSTLANILLRIFDFDEGQLLVNGVDIRHYEPDDYHSYVTALFQTFSKFNASLRENVGIGNVSKGFSDKAVHKATNEAGAYNLVHSLPRGLDTQLECMGHDPVPFAPGSPYASDSQDTRHGLSGGEWQRVAISRALMRARQADLLVLDEPTSHLDAHAQNNMLKSVNTLCRSATGEKTKSLILITHQLSLARRADKIAMFENGTITEFGTHDELMARPNSNYAQLYQAIE